MSIHTKRYYRQVAKAAGLKKPGQYAKHMYRKQYEKRLPHGLIGKFETALRTGKPVAF